jgi:uncharacterized membrane protein YoaK (UPF0700 family)
MFLVFGVFTANQTGNVIILAVAIAEGRLATGLLSGVSAVAFTLGIIVGELVIVGRRDAAPRPRPFDVALAAELLILVLLFSTWVVASGRFTPEVRVLLVGLAAAALGIQSAAVSYRNVGATTTYVTGMLTTFVTKTVRWLYVVETRSGASATLAGLMTARDQGVAPPWLLGVTWIVYVVGAVLNAILYLRIGEVALLLPIAAILAVVVSEINYSGELEGDRRR